MNVAFDHVVVHQAIDHVGALAVCGEDCKIFINRGKGAKDRCILFPANLRLVLKSHLRTTPRNRYLFETRRFGPFTTRRIQLTARGLTDAQIQLISVHKSKKSLEIYQHLSLESVDKAYQDAVQSVGS